MTRHDDREAWAPLPRRPIRIDMPGARRSRLRQVGWTAGFAFGCLVYLAVFAFVVGAAIHWLSGGAR